MIDKKIFQLMLSKLNDDTINTQGVKFKGNFVFVRMNDYQTLASASTYNPYDTVNSKYIGVAEIVSIPTDYVESNNRTEWLKTYAFQFRANMKDEALEALQEVYLYFKSNTVQTIVDDTTYKLILRVNRPKLEGAQQQAGSMSIMYSMDLAAVTIETGYYGNEVTHEMGLGTATPTEIIADNVSINSLCVTNPKSSMTENKNTTHKFIGRTNTLKMQIYYDGTTLTNAILNVIEGKLDRDTEFVYQRTINSVTVSWDIKISSGNIVYKTGQVMMLNIDCVEV